MGNSGRTLKSASIRPRIVRKNPISNPPATELEIRDASLQFVRKLSGFNVPSKANDFAFEQAVEQVAASARLLISTLVTTSHPKNREAEAIKARQQSAAHFGGKTRTHQNACGRLKSCRPSNAVATGATITSCPT